MSLLVLAGAPLAWIHVRGAARIANHLEGLRAEGVPLTLEETTSQYRSLDATENGASHYEKAFATLKNVDSLGNRKLIGRGSDFDAKRALAEDGKFLESMLRRNSIFFAYLGEATKWERAAYDLDFEEGFHMPMKHLNDMKSAFRCLELHSIFAAEREDTRALIRNIEQILTLADSIREEPVLISTLVRVSGMAKAAALTEAALQLGKPSEEELRKLNELWKGREVRSQFIAAMKFGRWSIREVFEGPSSEVARLVQGGSPADTGEAGATMGMSTLSLIGAKKGDYLFFLKRYRELEEAWEKERLPLAAIDRLQGDLDALRMQTESGAGEGIWMKATRMKIISRMTLPGELRGAEMIIAAEIQIDLVRAGLAVAAHQARKGEMPRNIDEVEGMNSVWLNDVFSGGKMRLIKDENGLTLYSVGRNRTDDGGLRPMETRAGRSPASATGDDIAFFVRHW